MERKGIIKKTISKNAVQMTIVIIAVVCNPLANGRIWGWTLDSYKIGGGTHRTSYIVNWVNSNPCSLLLPNLYSYHSNHGNIYNPLANRKGLSLLNEDEYYEPPKPPIIPIPAIIPLQGIAGAITGLGGLYPGMISAMYIHNAIRPAKRCDIPEAYYGSAIIGGLTGFSVGAPVGIWAVGKCFGLEGSFGKTFRGSLIGSVGFVAMRILITGKVGLWGFVEPAMAGSILGGLFGFYVKTERSEEIK